jgi:hypothetical protein
VPCCQWPQLSPSHCTGFKLRALRLATIRPTKLFSLRRQKRWNKKIDTEGLYAVSNPQIYWSIVPSTAFSRSLKVENNVSIHAMHNTATPLLVGGLSFGQQASYHVVRSYQSKVHHSYFLFRVALKICRRSGHRPLSSTSLKGHEAFVVEEGAHTAGSNACPARRKEMGRVEHAKQVRNISWQVAPRDEPRESNIT